MRWEMSINRDRPDFEFDLNFDMDLSGIADVPTSVFFQHGFPIPPTMAPLRFTQGNSNSNYPDLFEGRFSRNMIVSARMRAVIERVAPPWAGLQFVPVVINRDDGQPGPDDRFYFKVCELVEAIVPEKSEVARMLSPTTGEFYSYDAWIGATFTFRDEVVANRHIWVDKHLEHRIFISGEMRAAMMAADLTGVNARR